MTDRPEITLEEIKIGMILYTPDFQSPNGIEEMIVKRVIHYKTIEDPHTGDLYSEPTEEVADDWAIELAEGWSINRFEKFANKIECQKYMLIKIEEHIVSEKERISRWQRDLDDCQEIRIRILQDLR